MPAEIGIPVHDLATPCLVIDLDTLVRNIAVMQAFACSSGKALRPHVKSHKCTVIARCQAAAGALGLSAATVPEVEGLIRAGITGVLLTSPAVSAPSIARLLDCRDRDPSLIAIADSAEHALLLDSAASERRVLLDVLLDLDVGLHRTGVAPRDAIETSSRIADMRGLRFRGIQAYAGHVQHIAGWEERRRESLACMETAAAVYRGLRVAGLPCDILSGTGTGTHDIDTAVPELTELQTGSYVLMDAEYLAVGSRGAADFIAFRPALTLLATVLSIRPDGSATIDAGLKALYRDGAIPRVVSPDIPGIVYDWFGDEFGRLVLPERVRLRPGDKVSLLVSHCDPTVALFDRYYAARNGKVEDVWKIDLRRG
jgi:D-serine deaminase-like pyridoxal phosphate-dependent protein